MSEHNGFFRRLAEFQLVSAREERDREAEYALKCDQLRWIAEEERDRAQAALRAIESLCSDEITARFGGHAHKSEDELGRNSRVYALLVVPRNIARDALKPVSDRQKERQSEQSD